MAFEPVELNLPSVGGSRGVWGSQINTAMQEMADGVNSIPEVTADEVSVQLGQAGVVPALDLVTELKESARGIMVSHRGGPRIHPEHTLEGYRDSARSGFPPEMDLRTLSTGEVVCVHDATTTRTMTGATATVSEMTLGQWLGRQVRSPWAGGQMGTPALWEDVLDEFGGRIVLVPEIKVASEAEAIIESVTRRGLHRAVILQSFSWDVAQQIAAAGVASMFLCGATSTPTPADLVAAGVEFLGPNMSMSSGDIAAFKAEGIKVVPYTVKTRAEWAALQAKNPDGAFFDDPWGATGRYARGTRDPFATSKPFYGWEYHDNAASPAAYQRINYQAAQGGLMMDAFSNFDTGTKAMHQGWAEKISVGTGELLRCRFRLSHDLNASATDRWAGVFIGNTPNDQAFVDGSGVSGQVGYHFLMRRNGSLDIFRIDSGASGTSLQTQASSPALGAADRYITTEMEVLITVGHLRLRRLDTGAIATVADGTYRSNLALHLTVNRCIAVFSNVSFEKVPLSSVF